MTTHPFLSDDYHIRWSTLTPDRVENDMKQGIALAEAKLEAIRKLDTAKVTLENTFLALESATEELGRGWGRLNHLDSVLEDDALEDALNKVLLAVSAFYSSISLDAEIWASLKAFRDSDAAKQMSDLQKRFVENALNVHNPYGEKHEERTNWLPEDAKLTPNAEIGFF